MRNLQYAFLSLIFASAGFAAPAKTAPSQPTPQKGAQYTAPVPAPKAATQAANHLISGVGGVRVGWNMATVGEDKHILLLNSDPAPDLFATSQSTSSGAMFGAFLGIEFPLRYSHPMRWQTAVGYYHTNSFKTDGVEYFFSLPGFGDKSYSYQVDNQRVLIENKFLFHMVKPLYGYVMGGVGISVNKAYDYKEVSLDPSTPANGVFQDNTAASLTYSLGFGLEAFIAEHFRMSFGYQYSHLGLIELGQYSNGNVGQTLNTSPTPTQELILQFTAVF